MGGQIAMEFARLHGARLRGIVLAATSPQAETKNGKHSRNATADRLLREGMGGYVEEMLPRMLAPRRRTALPAVVDHVVTMMRRPSYEPVLASLDIPALIVVGDEDAFTTRADADRMHTLMKGSQLLWMEGVGHMPNLE